MPMALAGCANLAAGRPAGEQWYDGWGIRLDERFSQVVGAGATDCGYVRGSAVQAERAHACAVAAFQQGRPFKVGFGVGDGVYELAVGRDAAGQAYVLTIPVPADARANERPNLWVMRCAGLDFSRRHDPPMREVVEGVGCAKAEELLARALLKGET
jgi:hypothetical protein